MPSATAGSVVLSRVDTQMVPVRAGEPLWPGPGFQVWEQDNGSPRRLVGFVPEAAALDVVNDYKEHGVDVSIVGELPHD